MMAIAWGFFLPWAGDDFRLCTYLKVPAVPKEHSSAFAGVNFSEKLLHFYDNHFFRIHFFFRKEVWGPCMRRQPIQEREPVREYRFF